MNKKTRITCVTVAQPLHDDKKRAHIGPSQDIS
jgi:hypothetical protein